MLVKVIEGCTRIVGKSQGYLGLPLRDVLINCSVNGPNTPAMEIAFEPTPKEIEGLKEGKSLVLRILGRTPPPIAMWVDSSKSPSKGAEPMTMSDRIEMIGDLQDLERISALFKEATGAPDQVTSVLDKTISNMRRLLNGTA